MIKTYFDVVVMGANFPGLLNAALLCKRGFRVLVLGQGVPAPTYALSGLQAPRDPHTFLAANSPLAHRAFVELSFNTNFRRRATALDPAFQVATAKRRLDMPSDPDVLEREIAREFPDVTRPIADFHSKIEAQQADVDALLARDIAFPPSGFFQRREFARATAHLPFSQSGRGKDPLGELPEDHSFRHLMDVPIRFATDLDPEQLPELATTRLYLAWLRGSAVLKGNYGWLRSALIDRVHTFGGEVKLLDSAERIADKRNVITGVELAGSGDHIACGHLISAVPLSEAMQLLRDRNIFSELFEKYGEPRVRWYRYTLNIVLKEEGVPEGIARDLFFLPGSNGREDDNTSTSLRVQTHARDGSGKRMVTVQTLLPRRVVEDSTDFLAGLRERILQRMGELFYFSQSHILTVDSPHDGRDVQHLQEQTSLRADEPWSRGPSTMSKIFGYPVLGPLGICGMPTQMPIKNMLLANSQVIPGLGMEGQILSAWSAARIISQRDKHRDPMRRGVFHKLGSS